MQMRGDNLSEMQHPADESEAIGSDSEPWEDDDDTDESPIDLLLDGVRDPIDRLYKLSTRVRNPSFRLNSSRAASCQHLDEETGIDFLQVIERADYDHIASLFLQYQKTKAL